MAVSVHGGASKCRLNVGRPQWASYCLFLFGLVFVICGEAVVLSRGGKGVRSAPAPVAGSARAARDGVISAGANRKLLLTGPQSCECAAGQTCADDGVSCTACPPGTRKPAYPNGSSYDPTCDYGQCMFWGSGDTVSQCVACGRGKDCVRGGCEECTPCAVGSYKDFVGVEPCSLCPRNTYGVSSGAEGCVACPAQSMSAAGSTSEDDCKCFQEYYTARSDSGALSCMHCPRGAVCGDSQVCALRDDSKECAVANGTQAIAGVWERSGNTGEGPYELVSCKEGAYVHSPTHNSQECITCSSRHYVLGGDLGPCRLCPPGLKCTGNRTTSVVVEGSEWVQVEGDMHLVSCPAGFVVHNTTGAGAFDASVQQCKLCGKGYEYLVGPSGGLESATCQPCKAGYWKGDASTAACEECPVNTYREEVGGKSCNDCSACPKYSTTKAGTASASSSACVCDAEFYRVEVSGNTHSCAACPEGGRCPNNSRVCALDLPNQDCDGDGESDMLGTWTRSANGTLELEFCPDGYSAVRNRGGVFDAPVQECVACSPLNHYIVRTDDGPCRTCPPGLECSGIRNVSVVLDGSVWEISEDGFAYVLTYCPAGYFLHNTNAAGAFDSGVQECKVCPAGYECPNGNCTQKGSACAPGTYKDSAIPGLCVACPSGTYNAASGSSSAAHCVQCAHGAVTSGEGSASASDCYCSGRYYQSNEPQDALECSDCPTVAICSDGTCALNDGGFSCPGSGRIIGDWERAESTGWHYHLVSCPNGTSKSPPNPLVSQNCRPCNDAEYILDPNTHECQACPPGLDCDGSEKTSPVVDGSVWEPLGMIMKLHYCPANYFIYEGESRVILDPPEQQCKPCPAGTECLTPPCHGECHSCPAGTYKDTSYPQPCSLCPVKTWNNVVGAVSEADCLPCFPGGVTVSAGSASEAECRCPLRLYPTGDSENPECTTCPVGAICLNDGSCALNNPGLTCTSDQPIGTWTFTGADKHAELTSCPAAHERMSVLSSAPQPHDDQQCKACLSSEYIIDPNTDTCKPCPRGLTCNGGPTFVPRLTGSTWEVQPPNLVLVDCPLGYVVSTDLQECVLCPAGTQCEGAGCQTCEPCPAGTFKDRPGTESCIGCPTNTYSESEGAATASTCIACPDGTLTVSDGSASAFDCICYGRQYRANGVCTNCPVGAICPDGTCALSFQTLACPGANGVAIPGNWTPTGPGGKMQVTACPAGYTMIKEPHNLQECRQCSPNEYQTEGDDTCKRCPRFLECDGSSVVPVTEGATTELVNGEYVLTACPAHSILETFEFGGITDAACTPCPKGKECSATPCTECTDCKAGFYKDFSGANPCRMVPANKYSDKVGADSASDLVPCPTGSTTAGLSAQTSFDACVCDPGSLTAVPSLDPFNPNSTALVCQKCPRGALCDDGTCRLMHGGINNACPDDTPPSGIYAGPDDEGEYEVVACPIAHKFHAEVGNTPAYCEPCTTCPTGMEWCRTADYIIDPVAFECEPCPKGALCNGAELRSPPALDGLAPAARWEEDGAGRFWLKECPAGYQLINNTGYYFQECHQCAPGESLLRSDDPAYKCGVCPTGMFCSGSDAPIFADEAYLGLQLSGIAASVLSNADSAEVGALIQSVAEAIGVDLALVLVLEVCDSITLDCFDLNSVEAQNAARRAFAHIDPALRRAKAQAAAPSGKRRQYGFHGEDFCPEIGMYVRLKIEIPVSSTVSAFDVQQAMLSPTFADKLDGIFRYHLGEAGLTEYLPLMTEGDPTTGMCMNVLDSGLPGLAQGRIGWVYNVSCDVPEGEEVVTVADDGNGTNVTVVSTYAGDKVCEPLLVDCPEGYLFVNTTKELTRCTECGRGTYSFEAYDGCYPLNPPFDDVVCPERVCNPCPDDPIGGAICCGRNIFFELTEGSVWENFDFLWPDGHSSVVRRLMSCPMGHSLIRDDSDPTSDHCLICPPYSFSLESSDWATQFLVFESKEAWTLAWQNKTTAPCNPCPPGSTCFGGNTVNASIGYWGDPEPFLCPPEACTGDPEVCDTTQCFDPPGQENRRRLLMKPSSKRRDKRRQAGAAQTAGTAEECGDDCRLRVYVHTCPAGGCELGDACAPGRTGPACGNCEEGLQMVGAECLSCDIEETTLILVGVLLFGPLLFSFFYFFSWKPLLFPRDFEKERKKEEAAKNAGETTWLESRALHSSFWKVVWTIYQEWLLVRENKENVSYSAYVKIIISFYNIVGTYPIVFNIYWPDIVATIMQITNAVAGVDFLGIPGFSCLGITLPYTTKLLINTLTPVVINLVFSIAPAIVMVQGMVVGGKVSAHPSFYDTVSRFCWSMAFTMALYFPPVSIQVMSSFRCDRQLNLLTVDYTEVCPLNDATGFIFRWSVFCTLIYPIGIPLVMYGMMWYYRVPHIARAKLNMHLTKALIKKYQAANATQESEMLVQLIGKVTEADRLKQRVQELFEMIDKDGGGSLDMDEMVDAFKKFGMAKVNKEKIQRLMDQFKEEGADDDEEEIYPDKFLEIIKQMTAVSFMFNGSEDSVEGLKLEQMVTLCNFDWNRVVRGKAAELGEKVENKTHRIFLPDFDDPASMCPWILQKARDLRAQGHLSLPSIPWDGSFEEMGEQLAIDRMGMVFAKFKVDYWYYELFDMLKKLLMTSILSFMWYGTAAQLFLGFFLLAAFLLSMLRTQPYDSNDLNNFNVYSYLIQCVVLLYGICIVADTDVDSAASDTFRSGWASDFIVFVIVTVALFPFASAFMGSKTLKRVGSDAKRRVRKFVSDILDMLIPGRAAKRRAREAKKLALKLTETRQAKSFFDDGVDEHAQRKPLGAADAVFAEDDRGAYVHEDVADVEMVPGFNCGPGVFRMYDERKGVSMEEGVHSELIFTAQGADRISSSEGSDVSFSQSESEEEDSHSNATDLRPAPRLGPARVRDVDPGMSVNSSRRGSFESYGGTSRTLESRAPYQAPPEVTGLVEENGTDTWGWGASSSEEDDGYPLDMQPREGTYT